MTEHDRVRKERAEKCDRDDLESLEDAIRGLQSTDDPSLNDLHDELMDRYIQLKAEKEKEVTAADCVFLHDDDDPSIGICTKADWNANRGYLPDYHEAQMRVDPVARALGLHAVSECSYVYRTSSKRNLARGVQILKDAGMTEVRLGQLCN